MKKMAERIVLDALFCEGAVSQSDGASEQEMRDDDKTGGIMCCEQKSGRLILMDAEADWSQQGAILWEWSADGSVDMRAAHKTWFSLLTECKRVLNGTHVIISASGGGIALLRMQDKKVIFYANPTGNTHSVERLPDGNLVSASSDGFLKVFCTDPAISTSPENTKFSTIELDGAHGVVWDKKLERLWAVGTMELVRYRYNGNRVDPALEVEACFTLPGDCGGHDLFPMPGTRKLFVSGKNVWIFDTGTESFSEFDPRPGVKSVTQKDANGLVFFMQSTESWWSDSIRSADGKVMKTRPGARFYKARWWVPNRFSYGE